MIQKDQSMWLDTGQEEEIGADDQWHLRKVEIF